MHKNNRLLKGPFLDQLCILRQISSNKTALKCTISTNRKNPTLDNQALTLIMHNW